MTLQRNTGNDPANVTNGQMLTWAAQIVRLSYEEDAQDRLIGLGMEMKDSLSVSVPGKLVRDGIPDIIQQGGNTPILDKVTLDNRPQYIRAKLLEEFNEYMVSGDVEELADIIEVCFTAASWQGLNQLDLLVIAYKKRLERGGFQKGIIWLGNENSSPIQGVISE